MEFIGFLFIVFAGLSEGIMDTLQFHYSNSNFYHLKNKTFWDPEISWRNKYKNGDPTEGPKFLFSTNLFVGLTDGWHLFKLLRTFFIFAGIFFIFMNCESTFNCLVDVIISRVLFGVSFSLSYDYLFK